MIRILAIIALSLFSFEAVAQSQQAPPSARQSIVSPPKEKPAANQQTSPQKQQGTEEAPFVIKILGAENANKESAPSAITHPQKSSDGWSLSDSIAVIASIVAALQFAALFATVIVMILNGRRQLRAYVFLEGASLFDGTTLTPPIPSRANEPAVALILKNSGQTPAYDFVSWAGVAVTDLASANTLIPPPIPPTNAWTVGSNCVVNKFIWLNRVLSTAEITDVINARKFIFVYGRLEYRDAFRRKRWSNFRLQYAGPFPSMVPGGALFNFSDSGNQST